MGFRGGRGGGNGRDKVKPKRGGPRHFTVHPRDLYDTKPREEGEESSSGEEVESGEEEVCEKMNVVQIGCTNDDEDEESSEEEEEKPISKKQPQQTANPNRNSAPKEPSPSSSAPVAPTKPAAPKQPHEMTRKEREAIEKERAKQHFLKIKEKEDGARLAVIRKQREEAAAAAAAAKKEKEEASMRRR